MKKEEINTLFEAFEKFASDYEGVECWSARELQHLLGYSQWRNFENSINKAKESCQNAGQDVAYHFADLSKMVEIGSGAEKQIGDILLTRYACYLVAQKGDSRKSQIAFAQNKRPVADFLPPVSIKAKDFAAAMPAENVQRSLKQNLSETQKTRQGLERRGAFELARMERERNRGKPGGGCELCEQSTAAHKKCV